MLERLAFLFDRYISRRSSPGEVDELMDLIQDPENKEMVNLMLDQVVARTSEEEDLSQESAEEILAAIFQVEEKANEVVPVHPLHSKPSWKVWLAAASVLLLLGIGGYFLLFNKNTSSPTIAKTNNEIPAPASNRAVITLADGSKVYLDNASTGTIARQSDVEVVKNETGAISYQLSANNQQPVIANSYNTLFNPRGSQVITLILSDGTKVWLNSESSLKYPAAFTGKTREVEVSGEAYFEVTHNAAKPFIVSVPSRAKQIPSTPGEIAEDFKVEVLGTHFNINAYSNEESIKTTLLEGKVRLKQGTSIGLLKPGQQGIMKASQLSIENDIDLEKIMAWKENKFYFQDDDLQTIMRQLERWYNINVVYDDQLSKQYTGIISRNVPISKVLQLFERTAEVKFLIEGNTVHVRAAK